MSTETDTTAILILSDGSTWETLEDGTSTHIALITEDGFNELCEGSDPSQLDSSQEVARINMASIIQAAKRLEEAQTLLNEAAGLVDSLRTEVEQMKGFLPSPNDSLGDLLADSETFQEALRTYRKAMPLHEGALQAISLCSREDLSTHNKP